MSQHAVAWITAAYNADERNWTKEKEAKKLEDMVIEPTDDVLFDSEKDETLWPLFSELNVV